jgi:hypothetical protein
MQSGSETAGGKGDQQAEIDPQREAAYWRQQHPKQPYAKHGSYEQFEHAYKTGYNSFFQNPGKNFDDLKEDLALGYEQAKPGAALPWDTVLPAVSAAWDRLSGTVGPRDPSRGVREWL